MTAASAAPLPPAVATSRPANDIAVTLAAAVLWLLLALFVIYPLAMLFVRMLGDRGAVDFAALGALLTDKHQVRAFWNSLLLAFLVGTLHPKICEQDVVFVTQQDTRRLDISMHDIVLMYILQCSTQLRHKPYHQGNRQKIILPALDCSTLLTTTSESFPIIELPSSQTTMVPSSR